jgi:glycosyltransferase involved in cell wall biosynthesis
LPLAWLAGVRARVRTRNNAGHWAGPVDRLAGQVLNAFSTVSVSNCRAARRSLLEQERVNPCRARVLENGVDLERFLALAPPAGAVRSVGCVANLRPVKGVDVLAEAAARLRRVLPSLRFRVAGEGEQRGEVEALAARLGVAGRFELVGRCADVPAFLAGVDVAVLPSRSEGMSNALLEYMAAARPIVATRVGANPEVVRGLPPGLRPRPGAAAGVVGAAACRPKVQPRGDGAALRGLLRGAGPCKLTS